MSSTSTQVSVTRLLNEGNLSPLGDWLTELRPRLEEALRRRGRLDPNWFDDDLQDLMKAICSRGGRKPFQGRAAAFNYIFKGLLNRFVDHIREKGDPGRNGAAGLSAVAGRGPRIEEQAELAELTARASQTLAELGEAKRDVVILWYLVDLASRRIESLGPEGRREVVRRVMKGLRFEELLPTTAAAERATPHHVLDIVSQVRRVLMKDLAISEDAAALLISYTLGLEVSPDDNHAVAAQ